MSIPVSSLIRNAVTFPIDNSVIPLNLCTPPKEGVKAMNFQVNGTTPFPALIDLASIPAPPISQLCAMYVDASASGQDITVLFPDSGYKVVIQSGNALLFPVITSKQLPRFIISGSVTGGSLVNVFLLNQFVPGFGTEIFQNVQVYGNDVLSVSDRISYPAESFSVPINFSIATIPVPICGALLPTKVVMTGIQIYLMALATVAAQTNFITVKQDSTPFVAGTGTPILRIPVLITNALQRITVIEAGQFLNARAAASIHGPLFIEIDSVANLTTKDVYCNVQFGRNND